MSDRTRTRDVDDRRAPDALDALREMISPEMAQLRADLLRHQDDAAANALRASIPDEWTQYFCFDVSQVTHETILMPAGLCVGGIYVENPTGFPALSVFLNHASTDPPYIIIQAGHWKRWPVNVPDDIVRVRFQVPNTFGSAQSLIRGFISTRVYLPEAGSI